MSNSVMYTGFLLLW